MIFGDIFEYTKYQIMADNICYHECKLLKSFPGYVKGSTISRIYQRFVDGNIFFAEAKDKDQISWITTDYFSLTTVNV